ncbi:MAG: V-type ATP synthase subunit D [Chlamydiae bacterium RIFCSPHIGHO2_12_FULL_49_9]|nr:MAG: V-type ATP synthase subunit D [Chlamydiae bacterium RIFCSPHIGHO2_12_FULL_49_9]
MTVKLTKTELRSQQTRLTQLRRYLPTLQLKKAMLQFEVLAANSQIAKAKEEFFAARKKAEDFAKLLGDPISNLAFFAEVQHVKKRYENIAGVEIPILDEVVFKEADYFLFDTPAWTEKAAQVLRQMVEMREILAVLEEKKRALEKELREVSIRVNLFEKVLIPRAEENIKKIRIFLGDQQLAVVAQAKVAMRKIRLKADQRAVNDH